MNWTDRRLKTIHKKFSSINHHHHYYNFFEYLSMVKDEMDLIYKIIFKHQTKKKKSYFHNHHLVFHHHRYLYDWNDL